MSHLDNRTWVAITQQGRSLVLLGKRGPSGKNPDQWGLFGGHVDQEDYGLTNPGAPFIRSASQAAQVAVVRELKEETNLTVRAGDLNYITTLHLVRRGLPVNVYFWQAPKSKLSLADLKYTGEVVDYEWVQVKDWMRFPEPLHYSARMFFETLNLAV